MTSLLDGYQAPAEAPTQQAAIVTPGIYTMVTTEAEQLPDNGYGKSVQLKMKIATPGEFQNRTIVTWFSLEHPEPKARGANKDNFDRLLHQIGNLTPRGYHELLNKTVTVEARTFTSKKTGEVKNGYTFVSPDKIKGNGDGAAAKQATTPAASEFSGPSLSAEEVASVNAPGDDPF